MIKLDNCKLIFIDFDGVIVDSNNFKEIAIKKSIYDEIGRNKRSNEALEYFNKFAGVSRKIKLSKFFDNDDTYRILKNYSCLCENFFNKEIPTTGLIEFLDYIKNNFKNINIFILSGGEKKEIESFLLKNNLLKYFADILSSEKSKQVHLEDIKATKNDIFIGDSLSDLKASLKTGIQFILLEDYKSNASFPSEKIINDNVLFRTNNFKTLLGKLIL